MSKEKIKTQRVLKILRFKNTTIEEGSTWKFIGKKTSSEIVSLIPPKIKEEKKEARTLRVEDRAVEEKYYDSFVISVQHERTSTIIVNVNSNVAQSCLSG